MLKHRVPGLRKSRDWDQSKIFYDGGSFKKKIMWVLMYLEVDREIIAKEFKLGKAHGQVCFLKQKTKN